MSAVLVTNIECALVKLKSETAPELIRYEFNQLPDNAYQFVFELSDGQFRKESASLRDVGDQKILSVSGSYGWIGDDGNDYEINYISDENGYKATGNHLPSITSSPIKTKPNLVLRISPALRNSLLGKR